MKQLPDNYLVRDLPNEPRLETASGRWDYVSIKYSDGTAHSHRYFHVDCDCVCDDTNRCILCGALAP